MWWKLPESNLWITGEPEKKSLAGREHRVLVWNIYKASRKGLGSDLKRLASEAEFLFLQEALQQNQNDWLNAVQGYQLHMAQSFSSKLTNVSTGVAIAATSQPLEVAALRTRGREFAGLMTPKTSLFSIHQIEGQSVLMVSTHILNFVATADFIINLEDIAEKIAAFKGPVLLAGDFNTWSQQRFNLLLDIMKNVSLSYVPFEKDKRFLRLDHAFVRGLDVHTANIYHSVKSSDHYPFELTIKL